LTGRNGISWCWSPVVVVDGKDENGGYPNAVNSRPGWLSWLAEELTRGVLDPFPMQGEVDTQTEEGECYPDVVKDVPNKCGVGMPAPFQ